MIVEVGVCKIISYLCSDISEVVISKAKQEIFSFYTNFKELDYAVGSVVLRIVNVI